MAELLAHLARQLVDDADAVEVTEVQREGATVLQLRVAKDEVGKVIGRQGRIARALRAIVRASGAKSHHRVVLEILE
ncbi:MAG: KH domain-containing protein [Actinobacteria bacterium]|nr:MAG: KH domain-containing protein [Actinomycetota bacterium]